MAMKLYLHRNYQFESGFRQQELLDVLSEKIEFANSSENESDENTINFQIRAIKGFRTDSLSRVSGSVMRFSNKSIVSMTFRWKPFISLAHLAFLLFAVFLAVDNIRNMIWDWEEWLFPMIYLIVVTVSTVNFFVESRSACNEIRTFLEKAEVVRHKKTSRSGG